MISCKYVNQEYQAKMKILQVIDNINDIIRINGYSQLYKISDELVKQLTLFNRRNRGWGDIIRYADIFLHISEQIINSMKDTESFIVPDGWIMTRYNCMLLIDTDDISEAVNINHKVSYYKRDNNNNNYKDDPYYGYGGEIFTDEPLLIGNQKIDIEKYLTDFPENIFYPHREINEAIAEYVSRLDGNYVYECVPHHAHIDYDNKIAYYRCYSEEYMTNRTLYTYTPNTSINTYGYICAFRNSESLDRSIFPITSSMQSPLMTYNDKPIYRYSQNMFSFLTESAGKEEDEDKILNLRDILDWTLVENISQSFQGVLAYPSTLILPKYCNGISDLTSAFLGASFTSIRGTLPNQVNLTSAFYNYNQGILSLTELRIPNCVKLNNTFNNNSTLRTIYIGGVSLRYWSLSDPPVYKPSIIDATRFPLFSVSLITAPGKEDALSMTVYVVSEEAKEYVKQNSGFAAFSDNLVNKYLIVTGNQ